MDDLKLDLNKVITSYQQQLADVQLRATIAETWVVQYREEIERLTNVLTTTTTTESTSL